MRTRIRLTLAALAAAALAACGGGTGTTGSGTPASAELVAAGVPVFVAVDGDFESEQWTAVEQLVQRFPSGGDALDQLFSQLAESGVDFESDLKPALGSEVAIALTDLPTEGDPPVVLLTQPADPAKFEALLEQADEPPVWRIVDGWYVVGQDEAAIDGALADGDSLGGSAAFERAMGDLPEDALLRLYLDGPALTDAIRRASEEDAAGAAALGIDAGTTESVALALIAEAEGIRIEGVARGEDGLSPESAPSSLVDVVPADAIAFGAVAGIDDVLSRLLDTATQQTPELGQLEAFLGISVENDVLPLFAGESGFYLRPGAPVPEVTVVLSPEDPEAGVATLDRLLAVASAFGALGAAGGDGATGLPAEPSTVTIAGIEARQVPLGEGVVLSYGVVDGRVVLSTSEAGIADLAGDAPRLADDPTFQAARQAAGMPDETLGVLYVDLQDGIALAESFGGLTGAGPETLANLEPLEYLLVHASGDGAEARFAGFLGIG